ncbi:hypothetical protein ACIRG4_03115 [Streptomyces sp. NPDC102395]
MSPQNEDGAFAAVSSEPVTKAFGHGEEARTWQADKHPPLPRRHHR